MDRSSSFVVETDDNPPGPKGSKGNGILVKWYNLTLPMLCREFDSLISLMVSCLHCGNQTRNPKYCSRSCSVTANNLAKITKLCLVCSNKLKKNASKFCSQTCAGRFKRENKISAWLSGEWSGTVKAGLAEGIELYLKEQAGWRCQSPTCAYPGGWSEINPITGKVPVQIDHIDGNANNNRPENLIVLCPSCHSLTPTYGALNKNSTRTYRKDSYNKRNLLL